MDTDTLDRTSQRKAPAIPKHQIQIVRPTGGTAERRTCGACAAAQTIAGGQTICRLNPPARLTTGASAWPSVDPDRDWCLQWRTS